MKLAILSFSVPKRDGLSLFSSSLSSSSGSTEGFFLLRLGEFRKRAILETTVTSFYKESTYLLSLTSRSSGFETVFGELHCR